MTLSPPPAKLRDASIWKHRLGNLVEHATECPVVFIVGSGLSWSKGSGVWDVPTMLQHGQTMLLEERGEDPVRADRSGLPQDYQSLMDELGAHDPEAPNVLVRQGVLAACTAPEAADAARLRMDPQRQACLRLQARTDAWRLPPGVLGLARLIRRIEEVRSVQAPRLRPPAIVTTNFDGLIEIALRRESVLFEPQAAILDTQLRNVTHAVTLWHLHGSWLGETTLHTQQELQAKADQIQESLKRRFDGARVVALGYGAWEDVIFDSIREVFQGSFEKTPEVTWSFHESDEEKVRTKYAHVFRAFEGRLAGRVCFASGIDVHAELPSVAGLGQRGGGEGGRGGGAGDSRAGGGASENPSVRGAGASPEDEWPPNEVVDELLKAAPARHRRELAELIRPKCGEGAESELPNICNVVAGFCNVLEALPEGDARRGFALPAATVLFALARVVTERAVVRAKEASSAAGPLRVQTAVFAELLMAHKQGRDLRLVRRADAIRGVDLLYDETEDKPLEAGPCDGDWVAAFEQLLWFHLFPDRTLPFEQDKLLGRLQARLLRRRQCYALTNADTKSDVDWATVGSTLKEICLIPRSKSLYPLGFNEHTLADLISDFLKLAPHAEAVQGD